MAKSEPFNIAICGLGRIGKVHFDNFRSIPNVNVIFVIEAAMDVAKGSLATKKYTI